MTWTIRPSTPDDAHWIAELRAEVMRDDLERLGRFDPVYVRERFLRAFDPALTSIIIVDGEDAGSIAVRPSSDGTWLEHFYLATRTQGRGIGGEVLATVTQAPGPYRLNVLQQSRARRLYERAGFVVTAEDDIDVWMLRP